MDESIRLIVLARKYNVGLKTIVDFLNESGAEIISYTPSTKIPAKYEDLLDKEFYRDARRKETANLVKKKLDKQIEVIKEANEQSVQKGIETLPDRIKKAAEREKSARRERKLERRRANRKKNQSKSHNNDSDLKEKTSLPASSDYLLSWKDVDFMEGGIAFFFGGLRYEISVPQARRAYNEIKKSFAERLPPVHVHISGEKASLRRKIQFDNIVQLLSIRERLFHTTDDDIRSWNPDLGKFPPDLVKLFFPIPKTQYLDYLQSRQSLSQAYIPVTECQETIDGFLFTIKKSDVYLVIWESVKIDATHRASYVFSAYEQELPVLRQLLSDYIASKTPNKRLSLRQKIVQEFIGFDYWFVDHDDFNTWKEKIESLPVIQKHKQKGVLKKNESDVSYSTFEQEHTYEPVHNKIQNGMKEWLDNSGDYREVILEENNIDVKAISFSGEVHLFEVKTSSPKMCVREALGQILEYAHFKSSAHAQKLIIVGPQAPTTDVEEYMDLLRKLYHIPVWYRRYDTLHNLLENEV